MKKLKNFRKIAKTDNIVNIYISDVSNVFIWDLKT